MKIGFGILPDNDTHNFIRQIQLELHQKLGVHLSRQSPHITVKAPFDCENLPQMVNYLENFCQSIEPFEMELNGFNSFGHQVLFLDVAENQALTDLHWHLLKNLKTSFGVEAHELEGENVKFHASISAFQDEPTFRNAMSFLGKYPAKMSFKVQTIGIFYYLGPGNGWIINRRIDFQK